MNNKNSWWDKEGQKDGRKAQLLSFGSLGPGMKKFRSNSQPDAIFSVH